MEYHVPGLSVMVVVTHACDKSLLIGRGGLNYYLGSG